MNKRGRGYSKKEQGNREKDYNPRRLSYSRGEGQKNPATGLVNTGVYFKEKGKDARCELPRQKGALFDPIIKDDQQDGGIHRVAKAWSEKEPPRS